MAPPLPGTPPTVLTSRVVSNSQTTFPSMVEWARITLSAPPAKTTPSITVTATELLAKQPGFLDAKPLVNDAANQNLSTFQRQSGILVNLHSALSLTFSSDIPNKFGHQDQMNNLLRGHN